MQSEYENMAAQSICHAAQMAQASWQEAAGEYMRPSVVFKPTLTKDGNMWCALFGADLMQGVSGFGETPAKAMWAFDTAWFRATGEHTVPRENTDATSD